MFKYGKQTQVLYKNPAAQNNMQSISQASSTGTRSKKVTFSIDNPLSSFQNYKFRKQTSMRDLEEPDEPKIEVKSEIKPTASFSDIPDKRPTRGNPIEAKRAIEKVSKSTGPNQQR